MKRSAAVLVGLAGVATAFVPSRHTAAPLARPTERRSAVEEVTTADSSRLDAWAAKHHVQIPMSSDKIVTKFDKFKARYRGAYVLDLNPEDEGYDTWMEERADFCEAVEGEDFSYDPGQLCSGKVVQYISSQQALIEIGAKSPALLTLKESTIFSTEEKTIQDMVEMDQEYEVQIVGESRDGYVLVSIRRIMFQKAWEKLEAMKEEDPVFEAEVVAVNRGGAIVLVEGLRAFLPGSHMMGPAGATEAAVGTVLPLKFLEVSPEANKLVVSNRRAIIESQMAKLSRGDVLAGTVAAIKPYGAFVEVNGMSGLLHISQISYDRIESLPDVLSLGQPLKCMIIDHDQVNGRIALSTKVLEPEPGDMLRHPQRVYDLAEETASKYHARMEAERRAREQAAKEIVMGLSEGLDSLDALETALEPAAAADDSAGEA